MPRRQIKLGLFFWNGGHHIAAWRHPNVPANGAIDFAHYIRMAKTAERGLFDFLFAADFATIQQGDPEIVRRNAMVAGFEPFSLMCALASQTNKIGLVCTSSTTYDEPYHIARRFASLDLISGGRAGWNLVTSAVATEAQNFGRDTHLLHDARYARGREFVDVVRGLWDSWDDDAFLLDQTTGIYFVPEKMHVLDHVGTHFRVRGPLNVPRSRQGRPVIVQAGSSEAGKELAAHSAEVVFTAHQNLRDAKAFYADLKSRLAKYGRLPEEVIVLPGIFAVAGRTEQEAQEKFDSLQALIHPKVGLNLISTFMNVDLSAYPIDGPLPDIPEVPNEVSRRRLLRDLARTEQLTIRQLYLRIAGARGHRQIVGTPRQIVDELEAWIEQRGADGFNFMPPMLPESLDDFVELVIPELQRRGLFRTRYEGDTLRENLGLQNPPNRFAKNA